MMQKRKPLLLVKYIHPMGKDSGDPPVKSPSVFRMEFRYLILNLFSQKNYFHFKDEALKTQRDSVNYPRLHSLNVTKSQNSNLRACDFRGQALTQQATQRPAFCL